MNTHAALAEYLRLDRDHGAIVAKLEAASARHKILHDAFGRVASVTNYLPICDLSEKDRGVVEALGNAYEVLSVQSFAARGDMIDLEHAELDAREARDAWGLVHRISAEVAT